jgi:hypothetical protein
MCREYQTNYWQMILGLHFWMIYLELKWLGYTKKLINCFDKYFIIKISFDAKSFGRIKSRRSVIVDITILLILSFGTILRNSNYSLIFITH